MSKRPNVARAVARFFGLARETPSVDEREVVLSPVLARTARVWYKLFMLSTTDNDI